MGTLRHLFQKKVQRASVTQYSIASANYTKNALPLILGLGGLAMGFFCLGYLLMLNREPQVLPYIVSVDRQGSVLASEVLKPSQSIPETALAAFMCEFTEKVFSICQDGDLQREYIRKIYSMVDLESPARRYLDEYYNDSQLFRTGANTLSSVKIDSVSRLSDNSFQVDYTVISQRFDESTEKHFKTVLSYRIGNISFENVEELRLNPLSVLIYEIKTSKKLVKEMNHA
ncbi:Type IV secretory pathway, TrbF components [Succinivibrio dextrinosolvens]|uniref:VirB8/TrbF family protein n=1 Tax=Succinivibrio dextrinosolvens TaxID=83771 RepID=UPI0008E197BA|nr:VirB8/TrbF family protein [Succinivibrio dextrinosolvens]SFS48831.1 Type IV secretory pathway, TrbF components [Succinivibrio dextrinosolvens]